MPITCDVAIVGAGFGGSLAALVLDRIGLRGVLVDRGSHPRYAIGESSTPVADLVLLDLARTYGLTRIAPLAKYGSWRAAYPDLTRGLKRGFSYFRQPWSAAFVPQPDHGNELLVAASNSDEQSDTHWFRPEVDAFLAEEAQAADIPYFDRTELTVRERQPRWRLEGTRNGQPIVIDAAFLLDASGEGAFLPRALKLADRSSRLHTRSWSVFGHLENVRPWREVLLAAGGRVGDHPFDCDGAALHQVLDDGWMWQLRFDNGLTSAGFVLDLDACPPDPAVSPQAEWDRLMSRYPSVAEQFAGARRVLPADGLRRTGRLQRMVATAAGENWALLPYTFGFIDALHSTGIAQTMCAIERLAGTFAQHWGRSSLAEELHRYDDTLRAEITLIDELVHGCYQSRRRFPVFVAMTMLYFAATTTYERRRLERDLPPGAAFLCADNPAWRQTVQSVRRRLREHLPSSDFQDADFVQYVAEAIAPFNHAGLCDPNAQNMYRYTAVCKDALESNP